MRRYLAGLPILVGTLISMLVAAGAAHATHPSVTPEKVTGNPKCEDYGLVLIASFDPVKSETKNGVTLTKLSDYYVKWTSTVSISKVIVKGGPNANVYSYPSPGSKGDNWLSPPKNPNSNSGKPYELSHVWFCGEPQGQPDPDPGIKLEKTGPADAYVGDTITYTLTVTNTGNVTLLKVGVVDAVCNGGVVTKVTNDDTFDAGDIWTYTCEKTITADTPDPLDNEAEACAKYYHPKYGWKYKCDKDDHQVDILKPAIELTKTGASFGYAGDTVTYSFTVKNIGDTPLTDVAVTDAKCLAAPVRTSGTGTTLGVGQEWTYTCQSVVPSGVGQVDNTAEVCGTSKGTDAPSKEVCDEDDHSFPVRSIGIDVVKDAVEQTAVAGTTVNFTISVTNTGDTSFVEYTFDDANCAEVRTGTNAGDTSLDPGETWTYSCAMPTQVGQTTAENSATATGTNSDGKSATDTDPASIPLTQPQTPENPPLTNNPNNPNIPGNTPVVLPEQEVLPETVLSGRARLRGPSGCVRNVFNAGVTGRSIRRVRFYVDGKLVKTVRGSRASYSVKVNPKRYSIGRHRVTARVRFVAASGTPARTLRLTFARCAAQTVQPRFTG